MLPTVLLLTVNGFYLPSACTRSLALCWGLDGLQSVVVPGSCLYLLAAVGRVPPQSYGWTWHAPERGWKSMTLAWSVVVVYPLTWLATVRLGSVAPQWWSGTTWGYGELISSSGPWAVPAWIYLAVSAAIVEETMYRALPLLWLRARWNSEWMPLGFAVGSSFLFALAHWEGGPPHVVQTFVLWLLLSPFYLRLRVLWPFMVGHALLDLIVFSIHI